MCMNTNRARGEACLFNHCLFPTDIAIYERLSTWDETGICAPKNDICVSSRSKESALKRKFTLNHISHQLFRISTDPEKFQIVLQWLSVLVASAFQVDGLFQNERLERVVRRDPNPMTISLDKLERSSQIRLNIAPRSDDEDDDVQDRYTERSCRIDTVFPYGLGIVWWEIR